MIAGMISEAMIAISISVSSRTVKKEHTYPKGIKCVPLGE